jgi:hypothetical protein
MFSDNENDYELPNNADIINLSPPAHKKLKENPAPLDDMSFASDDFVAI